MKTIPLALALLTSAACMTHIQAQTFSPEFKAAFDACVALGDAIGSSNAVGLKAANTEFRNCRTAHFSSLCAESGSCPSLDGHFIWDEEFIDGLINGREVRQFSQRYADARQSRAVGLSDGRIFTKTASAAAGSSVRFTFPGRLTQELAVVAEPGGRITLRIHDLTHDKWYNDATDEREGRPFRVTVFELGEDLCDVELEVSNRTDRDISFVVISN